MKNSLQAHEPIVLKAERDLRKNIRNINQRLNDHPDIARLILINPILALQEINIELSAEVKQHIMDSLRFPPTWIAKKEKVEQELKEALLSYHISETLPLSNSSRARILFDVIKLKCQPEDHQHKNDFPPERLPYYRNKHPLIDKIIEYERLKRGRLLFQPKGVFEDYKSGKRNLKWIKAVKFKV